MYGSSQNASSTRNVFSQIDAQINEWQNKFSGKAAPQARPNTAGTARTTTQPAQSFYPSSSSARASHEYSEGVPASAVDEMTSQELVSVKRKLAIAEDELQTVRDTSIKSAQQIAQLSDAVAQQQSTIEDLKSLVLEQQKDVSSLKSRLDHAERLLVTKSNSGALDNATTAAAGGTSSRAGGVPVGYVQMSVSELSSLINGGGGGGIAVGGSSHHLATRLALLEGELEAEREKHSMETKSQAAQIKDIVRSELVRWGPPPASDSTTTVATYDLARRTEVALQPEVLPTSSDDAAAPSNVVAGAHAVALDRIATQIDKDTKRTAMVLHEVARDPDSVAAYPLSTAPIADIPQAQPSATSNELPANLTPSLSSDSLPDLSALPGSSSTAPVAKDATVARAAGDDFEVEPSSNNRFFSSSAGVPTAERERAFAEIEAKRRAAEEEADRVRAQAEAAAHQKRIEETRRAAQEAERRRQEEAERAEERRKLAQAAEEARLERERDEWERQQEAERKEREAAEAARREEEERVRQEEEKKARELEAAETERLRREAAAAAEAEATRAREAEEVRQQQLKREAEEANERRLREEKALAEAAAAAEPKSPSPAPSSSTNTPVEDFSPEGGVDQVVFADSPTQSEQSTHQQATASAAPIPSVTTTKPSGFGGMMSMEDMEDDDDIGQGDDREEVEEIDSEDREESAQPQQQPNSQVKSVHGGMMLDDEDSTDEPVDVDLSSMSQNTNRTENNSLLGGRPAPTAMASSPQPAAATAAVPRDMVGFGDDSTDETDSEDGAISLPGAGVTPRGKGTFGIAAGRGGTSSSGSRGRAGKSSIFGGIGGLGSGGPSPTGVVPSALRNVLENEDDSSDESALGGFPSASAPSPAARKMVPKASLPSPAATVARTGGDDDFDF